MFLNLLIIDMDRTRGAFVRHGGSSSSHVEASEQELRQSYCICSHKRYGSS